MPKLYNQAALGILKARGFKLKSFNFRNSPVYFLEGGRSSSDSKVDKNKPSKVATLVIFPGYGDTVYSWLEFLLRYSSQYHILALDFPGYAGLSPLPTEIDRFSFEVLEEVATTFVRDHVKKADFLVGNSLGGWLAFKMALRFPDLIKHLIPINPAGIYTTDEELLRIRNLYSINSYKDFLHLMSHLWHKIPLFFYPFSLIGFYQHTQKAHFLEGLTSIDHSHFVNDQLKQLKIPVSLIWGLQDKLFGVHMAEKIIENTPRIKFFPIADAGHMPQIERPSEFYRILNFILAC